MPEINRYTPTLDRAGIFRFNRGPLNEWDACLLREKIEWANFTARTPPLPYCLRRETAPPWIVMPSEGKKFKRIGSLPVTNNFTGADLPLQFQGVSGPLFVCDNGYDGIITEIVLEVTAPPGGTGFVEASGDVTWRIGVDFGQTPNSSLYYFRDYGNITTSLGSLTFPSNLYLNGLRFISGQAITIYVNLLAAAVNRINPNAIIVGQVGGWTWPR